MKKSRFTESQILKILSEQKQGKSVMDICREHKISQPTFYQWKSKYSGIDINHPTKSLHGMSPYQYKTLLNKENSASEFSKAKMNASIEPALQNSPEILNKVQESFEGKIII